MFTFAALCKVRTIQMRANSYAKRLRRALLLVALLLPLSVWGRPLVFQRITTADGLSNNQVQHIEQLPDGRMLMVSWRGVNVYDGAHVTAFPRRDEQTMKLPHSRYSYDVAVDKEGNVWVKEYGRLWRFDPNNGTMLGEAAERLNAAGAIDIYFDHEGNAWCLTANELKGDGVTLPLPCHADSIGSVAAQDGKVMIFTLDGHVVVMSKDKKHKPQTIVCAGMTQTVGVAEFHTFRSRQGVYYRNIYAKGHARIDAFDPSTCTWMPIVESTMILYGMAQLDDSHLLVGCRHGVIELSLSSASESYIGHKIEATTLSPHTTCHMPAKFHPTFCVEGGAAMSDISVRSMCLDHRGGIWLGLADHGVMYAHPQRHRFASSTDGASLGIGYDIQALCHDRLQRLFRFTEQRDNDNLTDQQGRLWCATHNGINVKTDTDSLHISTADGLPSNFVQSMVEDRRGRIWAGTNRGICCIESTAPVQITTYGANDGVPEWDARASAAVMMDDGRIAMQFEQGWVAFHPDSVQRDSVTLTPILASATVNGKPHLFCPTDNGDARTLNADENNISLVFATDHYAFPQSISYWWRVNGGEWQRSTPEYIERGQLRLTFLHLHHGTFRLEVKASADNHTPYAAAFAMSFTILPPWWQTWWAYTLYIICAVMAVVVILSQIFRRRQEQMQQRMREEALLQQIETLMRAAEETTTEANIGTQASAEQDAAADTTDKLSPEESEWVQRAIELVHEHLADNYTVEQMAADLCMERTGLYKRLTSLVNQSPQLFIRSIRLNRAIEMMKQGDSITDAAFAAGFSSVSYFGRCFAKEFGCTPSEYLKKLGLY